VVGDNLFLREINTFTIDHERDVTLRTLPFTESRVGVLQRWDRMALHAAAIVYQDLIGPQSQALQRVPEIDLTGQKLLGFGTQGHLASSLVDFQREDGTAGFRLDLEPGMQLRLPLGRSVFGAVSARLRETAYQLTDNRTEIACEAVEDCPAGTECGSDGFCVDSVTGETTVESLPRTQNRATVELRADLGTSLSRIFAFPHLGALRLKHTIEPQLEYFYVPSVSQGDLPSFDGLDHIGARQLITYGVTSRLLARMATPAGASGSSGQIYELARASATQSYDLDRRIPSIGDPANTGDHFSDVDLAVRVNPTRYTSVRVRSSYDTGITQVSQATIGVRLQEALDPSASDRRQRLAIRNALAVSYRFITDNRLQQLGGSVALRLTDRFGMMYATRYDIPRNRFLENYVGMRLVSACDCWSLVLGVADKSNPNEVELRAQFTLVGLGSTGPEPKFGGND
jgi:lipopolysaccharide assembly outer membrane protein LptD (OstA)